MNVGALFSYSGYGLAQGATLTYHAQTVETVDGVQCLKVLRTLSADYDNIFWLAQDTHGAIWQLRKFDAHPLGGYDETDTLYLPA